MRKKGVDAGTRPGMTQERVEDRAMRHGNAHRKFNRRSNQRSALFQHLASALIKHEQISPRCRRRRICARSSRS